MYHQCGLRMIILVLRPPPDRSRRQDLRGPGSSRRSRIRLSARARCSWRRVASFSIRAASIATRSASGRRRATTVIRIPRWWSAVPTTRAPIGMRCTTCHQNANYEPSRRSGTSAVACRAEVDGVADEIAGADLRADQGPAAQRRQDARGDPGAHGARLAGGLGAGCLAETASPRPARRHSWAR